VSVAFGTDTFRNGMDPLSRSFWHDLNAGVPQDDVFRRIRKDGREIWMRAVYGPVRDAGGKVVKVVKVATDVTEARVRALDAAGQLAAISKPQAVIEFRLDGTILGANDNFMRTLGYSLDEIRGRHHSMFADPAYAASDEYRRFWAKLGRGEFDAGEYRRLGKGGREVWIQASCNPILDLDGKPVKVVKYASDVTAQVKAAESLRAAVEEALQVANAAKQGDLSPRVPTEGRTGPIADRCQGINSLMETTARAFADGGRVFAALSTGDLTQRIGGDASGVFAQVRDDANLGCEKLAAVIDEVRSAAEALTGAANQVSATAQSLSQPASEQASTVEETTASIDTMSASISQNSATPRSPTRWRPRRARRRWWPPRSCRARPGSCSTPPTASSRRRSSAAACAATSSSASAAWTSAS
jgi:methyl-accepting chemotaxis protein